MPRVSSSIRKWLGLEIPEDRGNDVPNLQFEGSRKTALHLGSRAQAGAREPSRSMERDKLMDAMVLCFSNEPSVKGNAVPAAEVFARILYREPAGGRVRVEHGVWVNSPTRAVDIGFGEAREVVLFVWNHQDMPNSFLALHDHREAGYDSQEPWKWCSVKHVAAIASATVTLTSQKSKARYSFDFDISPQGNGFAVELVTARPSLSDPPL